MTTKQHMITMVCACVLVTVTAMPSVCTGEVYKVKEGIYVGVSALYNWMSGDFDDSIYFEEEVEEEEEEDEGLVWGIVPDVDDGGGFGVIVGWRRFRDAIELNYQCSVHDVSTTIPFMADKDVWLNSIDINYKLDVFEEVPFFARRRMRPYVLVGLAIPWMTLDDIYWSGRAFRDETFWGLGLNLGVGLNYYLDPQWALTGGVMHRWSWFSEVGEMHFKHSLEEETLNISMGVTYTF